MYHTPALKEKEDLDKLTSLSQTFNNTEGSLEATLKVTISILIGPGEAHGNKTVSRKTQQATQIFSHKGTYRTIFVFLKAFLKSSKKRLTLTHLSSAEVLLALAHLPVLASVISCPTASTGPARTVGGHLYQALLPR